MQTKSVVRAPNIFLIYFSFYHMNIFQFSDYIILVLNGQKMVDTERSHKN